jgi:hypothetical protein
MNDWLQTHHHQLSSAAIGGIRVGCHPVFLASIRAHWLSPKATIQWRTSGMLWWVRGALPRCAHENNGNRDFSSDDLLLEGISVRAGNQLV